MAAAGSSTWVAGSLPPARRSCGRWWKRLAAATAPALDDLVRATYSGTYTLAFRLTGHEDDARDVVQEAYLRAYRGCAGSGATPQFTTWLYRITANCSANLLAKRARTRTETLPTTRR